MSDFVPTALDSVLAEKPEGQMKIPGRSASLALSAAMLAITLQVTDGLYSQFGIILLSISLILCIQLTFRYVTIIKF